MEADNILLSRLTHTEAKIAEKVLKEERLSSQEGLQLYSFNPGTLGMLANYIREKKNQNYTYFNRNIHIEPSNICVYDCKFCSYHRKAGEEGSWEYSINNMIDLILPHKNKITEVHIVGGVHPHRDIHFYIQLITAIKSIAPHLHIKAFTAVELDYMIKKARLPLEEGLKLLKESGLDSIPGGGAEIFDDQIRKELCHEKSSSEKWLKIHEAAHRADIPSNATMLYGHIETKEQRIHHLNTLRNLQDKTGGFNAFIPLKFKSANNELSYIGEVNALEDMKNYAVSRIFLDNIPHIKAYWPMIGKDMSQLALSFGVDDIDGTIDDSTKIYSMAGSEEQKPVMTINDIVKLITAAKRIPVERDSVYNTIRTFDE